MEGSGSSQGSMLREGPGSGVQVYSKGGCKDWSRASKNWSLYQDQRSQAAVLPGSRRVGPGVHVANMSLIHNLKG